MNIQVDTYHELFNLLRATPMLRVLQDIHSRNVSRLKNKKKIKIAFQVALLSVWTNDMLPVLFDNNARFEVTIVITWQRNTVYAQEVPPMIAHFKKLGLRYCVADGSVNPSDFDIIFYTSPYLEILDNWGVKEIPLTTLLCYIPYGYCVEDLQPMMFNGVLHNVAWKNYVPNSLYKEMGVRWCALGNYNMVDVGCPKLDSLIVDRDLADKAVWKIHNKANKVTKIIYAPHHSISDCQCMSTFGDNYKWMLKYAKEHADTTSWVFKPHPLLIKTAVENGIFSSEQEYRHYCEEWNNLPNCSYVTGGYLEYFQSSDCMIFDSMSFMVEYLFVNKPSLFLTREKMHLSELGECVIRAHSLAKGNDYQSIKKFIEHDVHVDDKKNIRRKIFMTYLEYFLKNGKLIAAEKIYNDIIDSVSK